MPHEVALEELIQQEMKKPHTMLFRTVINGDWEFSWWKLEGFRQHCSKTILKLEAILNQILAADTSFAAKEASRLYIKIFSSTIYSL